MIAEIDSFLGGALLEEDLRYGLLLSYIIGWFQ